MGDVESDSSSSPSSGACNLENALSASLLNESETPRWRRLLAPVVGDVGNRFAQSDSSSSDNNDAENPDNARVKHPTSSSCVAASRTVRLGTHSVADAALSLEGVEAPVAPMLASLSTVAAPVPHHTGASGARTILQPHDAVRFSDKGRLPRAVERDLNSAWAAAGERIPGEDVMIQFSTRYGADNLARLRKYFSDKARRHRREKARAPATNTPAAYGAARLQKIERFLFPSDVVTAECPTIQRGLSRVLDLETAGGLNNLGVELRALLSNAAGFCALRAYQSLYWSSLRSELMTLSTLRAVAKREASANIEFRMRLLFSTNHARYHFGAVSTALATRRGSSDAADAIADSLGRRVVTSVNDRVRDFLLEERRAQN